MELVPCTSGPRAVGVSPSESREMYRGAGGVGVRLVRAGVREAGRAAADGARSHRHVASTVTGV